MRLSSSCDGSFMMISFWELGFQEGSRLYKRRESALFGIGFYFILYIYSKSFESLNLYWAFPRRGSSLTFYKMATLLGMFRELSLNLREMLHLIIWLVHTLLWCLCDVFPCFKACEYWHGDYLYLFRMCLIVYCLWLSCSCIYLLMFVYICFTWLNVAWLPSFCMVCDLLVYVGHTYIPPLWFT